MSQPRRHSLVESVANVAVGYALSLAAVQFIFPLYGIHMSLSENIAATNIMTVVSVARSYALRRAFNAHHGRRRAALEIAEGREP